MPLTAGARALSEAVSHPLAQHSRSVAELATVVAGELGLDDEARQDVEIAALMHDIGKLGLMDELIDKSEGLTAAELDLVRMHPLRGQEMLERVGGRLARVGRIVRACHERWDGRGYPDGLVGEEIPLAARIVFCCDAYDAMVSERPYSRPLTRSGAVAELWACAGTQFDPEVVAAVVRSLPQVADGTFGVSAAGAPSASEAADAGRGAMADPPR